MPSSMLTADGEGTIRNSSEFLDDQSSLSCSSASTRSTTNLSSTSSESLSRTSVSGDSLRPFSDDEDALNFENAKLGQLHLSWYLRPSYTSETLKVDSKGLVRAGTIHALVEKLTVDPITGMVQDVAFRNVFLTTFRTFVTAERLLDLLIARYQMDYPPNLEDEEFNRWKEQKLRPVRQRVLTTIKLWIEDYHFVDEGPDLVRNLIEFLKLVVSQSPSSRTAQHILEALQKPAPVEPPKETTKRKWLTGKTKVYKGDIVQLEPEEVAQHLSLYEHNLYCKIKIQECLSWTSTQSGQSVANLLKFCDTHTKLTRWVKWTIIENDVTMRRAAVVEFWVAVAQGCHNLNNFSSMSAIVSALSSATISKLHMTWAAVNPSRAAQLRSMLEHNNPSRAFASYRSLLRSAEGPTVPFVPMFLTELTHIRESIPDTLENDSSSGPLLLFVKQQRLYNAITTMLQHRSRTYQFSSEKDSIAVFVAEQIRDAEQKDEAWFWSKTHTNQAAELGQTDIRASMAVAGFQ